MWGLGPEDYIAFRSRRTFSSLDGLRCASIATVVWHHTAEGIDWLPATRNGFLGVDMFFVISGFLIVTLILRERDEHGSISLRRFYARRTLRIFPIYYSTLAALSLFFLLVSPGAKMAAPFFSELPFFLTYTSNWIQAHSILGIAWSLATEEQFYLAWPPMEKLLKRWAVPLLLVVIAVNQLVNFRIVDEQLSSWLGIHYEELAILHCTFTPICLGVLLAHVLHSHRGFTLAGRLLGSRWSSLAVMLALLLAANIPGDIAGWPRLLIQVCMMLLICSCVVREDHSLRALLIFAPIQRIGKISYGIYLYHLFCKHGAELLLDRLDLHWPGALFLACFGLTFLVAELSYRFYEKPFLSLKRHFAPG